MLDSFLASPVNSSYFLRAILEVDPEDGIALQKAEWSIDGFAWELFGDELMIEAENTRLSIGFGSTGYRLEPQNIGMQAVADSCQLFGPYEQNAIELYRLRSLTQGGRNWPG
jgi:hypothetical protein